MTDKLIVYVTDIPLPEMCIKGARQWFIANDLVWHDFLKNGIDAEILLAIDDAMAHQVVEVARGRTK